MIANTAAKMAMDMGMTRISATAAIPFLWQSPSSSDPLSPIIIQMINALQRTMITMGVPISATGVVDPTTINALEQISGDQWKDKSWNIIFRDVLRAKRSGYKYKRSIAMGHYISERGYGSLGDVAQGSWCSDKNPQGSCRPLTGVCKPMDASTLATFKALQSEINRFFGKAKVAVDGRLGPSTSAAVTQILGTPFLHCDQLAAVADGMLVTIKALNDKQSKGQPPSSPPFTVASTVRPDGTVEHPSNPTIMASGLANALSSPLGLAGVGVGVFLFLSSRKKAKKPARARRTKTRRARRR